MLLASSGSTVVVVVELRTVVGFVVSAVDEGVVDGLDEAEGTCSVLDIGVVGVVVCSSVVL